MTRNHHSQHIKIYKSKWHLFFTILLLIGPFIFLLFFAHVSHITTTKLFSDISISIVRLFISYIVALILAWVFAALFYGGKQAVIALPVFDVLQSFPTYAALPLAVLIWGASNFTIIFFLVLAVIWPIFFSIISSFKLVQRDWIEAVEVFNLKGLAYFKKFLIPVSIPGIITGSIIGLGDGWEALVATEIIVGIKSGLGSFFQSFATNPTITAMGILSLLLIIFSINKLVWLPLLEWSHIKMKE